MKISCQRKMENSFHLLSVVPILGIVGTALSALWRAAQRVSGRGFALQ
jgi:hypothetical protein